MADSGSASKITLETVFICTKPCKLLIRFDFSSRKRLGIHDYYVVTNLIRGKFSLSLARVLFPKQLRFLFLTIKN